MVGNVPSTISRRSQSTINLQCPFPSGCLSNGEIDWMQYGQSKSRDDEVQVAQKVLRSAPIQDTTTYLTHSAQHYARQITHYSCALLISFFYSKPRLIQQCLILTTASTSMRHTITPLLTMDTPTRSWMAQAATWAEKCQ